MTSFETKPKVKIEFINTSIDTVTNTTKISISDLIKKYKSLQGKYIETKGIVYWEFENVAICNNKGQDSQCFWLNLNRDLNINDSLLQKVSGEQITLKGIVDTTSKGHLNAYLATIKNVYYLKQ